MRICFVSHSPTHFTAPYVDFFASAGHEVHLVSLHHHDLPNAVNHHPSRPGFDPMKASWVYFTSILRVRRVIRSIKPDLVHAHYVPSNGMMAAMAGVHPLVVTAHGSDIYHSLSHPVRRWAIRFTMNRADLVNPVSRDLERTILSLGIPAAKLLRLTLGIDTTRFACSRREPGSGRPRIICTRNMFPVYRCDTVLRAAQILKRRGIDFELTFAGTGPDEFSLRTDAQSLGLAGSVRFLGGYKPDQLPALLAGSDVYVSASASDGTSLSLLEALAAGLYPVVSDIPANREWLTGEGDGLLFEVGDHARLADCLERAVTDRQQWTTAARINRRRVEEEGDRRTNMKRLAQHYQRLIEERACN